MFYGSDEFNSAIENTHGNAPKTRLKFADDEILDLVSSIRYYGGSNDSDDVSIGTTTMARVEVSAYTDKLLANREFLLEQGIELANGVVEYMPIGYFTIQKPSGDIDQVTFTAYDRMQKFEKPYSSSLAYPTTSILILDELCQICGIELATAPDNAIEVTENLKGYTCREVLGYIASMHGYFACIDRYGRLNLRWYSNTPIKKSLKKIWHFEKSQDNFEIAKVEIAKNSETNYVSGDGITTLHNSNPLATQEITDDVFAKLGGFSYSVGEIEMLDDARLDPWDMVSVEYYDGKTYNIPCMSLEHDFKAYSTTVKSVGKSESENEYRFTGPTIQYLNRMAADLLVANRVIATKVDAEYVNSVAITTENFDAKVAEIKELVVEEIDGKYATIDFANIDVAHINKTNIGLLFAEVGLLDRATIVDGHVTGFLDAVEINANKITAGTLIADRILLSGGDKGVLYALNNLGELTSTNVDSLDGYVLTDRTINADKLIANSITANELDVNQIFGNEAVLNKIVSQDIFTDAIETNRIIVGASENASKALQEVNKTVKSITMHYLATTLASGVTISTSGWTTTVQQIDATKKYLWTYQTITYVDNTTTDTSPVISGVYGNEGVDGQPGENGVGITSVTPLYYLKSNTTAPSAPTSAVTSTSTGSGVWTKSVPTYVNNYTYFTCTQTQYTDGAYKWSTVVSDTALTDVNASIIGDNLIPYPYSETTHTQYGITWTDNGDGTITANGTNTDTSKVSQFYFNTDTPLDLKPNTAYTLSGCPSGGATSTYRIRIIINYQKDGQAQYSDVGNGVTFTTPSNYTDCRIMIDVNSGVTVNNLIFKPMIEKGSVAHAYQPYVMSRQGLVEQILADNLLIYPYVDTTRTNVGITFTDLGNGQIRAKGTQTAGTNFRCRSRDANVDKNQLILPKGTYTISGCPSGGSLTTYYLQAGYTGDNGSWASLGNDYGEGVIFTLTKDTAIQLLIIIDDNCPTIDVIFKPMIEVGTVIHPYREYSKGGVGITNNIYQAGTTLIDGAKIYTGSITADKIDVDDLFAEDITATGTIRGAILKSINYDEDTGVGMLLDLNNATIESRGEDFVNIFDSKGHYGRYTLAPEGMIFAEERDYLTGQPNLSIINGQLTLNNVKYNSYGINYGGSDIINWTTKGIATPKLSTDLIYCNGEIAAKTIKASVVQNSTYNLQSVGNMAVKNKQDIATINSNLSEGLVVDYEYLSYSDSDNNKEGALVTTTKTSYSTQIDPITNAHRKFSSYQYLNFELLINENSVRDTKLIPRTRFTDQPYSVELFYVDSANVQRWIDVIFKDDTSFYMVGSSNIVEKTRVAITGLKAKL